MSVALLYMAVISTDEERREFRENFFKFFTALFLSAVLLTICHYFYPEETDAFMIFLSTMAVDILVFFWDKAGTSIQSTSKLFNEVCIPRK